MNKYDPKTIEPKWQQMWADTKLYAAITGDTTREKYYMLTEFPYPSGEGLHAGHAREYTLGDVIARHKRMQGYNVLYPMGYDAFGLPTENYAIKHKIRPQDATAKNVANFRKQFDALGYSIDWDRQVNTTDPDYYRWTQWLFLKFYQSGLAYQAEMAINWCPKEKTGLANEEVVDGKHERCGTPVEKKLIKQWMLKITAYADRLIEGLKTVDFPSRIADQQINWIGRSTGAEIDFAVGEEGFEISDTLKFTPELTRDILSGTKSSTIRLEAKHLKVGDLAKLITRVSRNETQNFAVAKITKVETLRLSEDMLSDYRHYYGDSVTLETECIKYDFEVVQSVITVYTTRPDTLAGATFLVLAPEHAAIGQLTTAEQRSEVEAYAKRAGGESEVQRQNTDREKTGVFTGAYATNPLSGERMPVWVADYVLGSYGTGAIMAVPAHDERDFAFATAFDLPITPVIQAPKNGKTALILHGTGGTSHKGWIPWMKSQLEAYGYEVIAPDFPNATMPVLRDWLDALKPYAATINQESLVIGHSLGAPVAEHFILENQLKVAKLLLVAPTFPSLPWEDYFKNRPDPSTQNIHDVSVTPVDWKHLEESVGEVTIFASKDDPHIDFGALKKHAADNLGKAAFVSFDSKSHFNEAAGIRALPEAIKYLIDDNVTGYGKLINSGQFDGLEGAEAKRAIVKFLEEKGIGKTAVKFKLRDWIFSRQHYWGEPIPIVHCEQCGVVAVPVDQLPITLPDVEHYEPTETGESPLAAITDWVNTVCPECGGAAKRETDTMPNWAGSSWYYLRYMDAKNDQAFASKDAMNYWGEVDMYLGGMEHTTLHLLYSRFWHQFLYDEGLLPTPEPYAARRGQGIVLATDGRKMSKSIGNVVNPTDIIATHGADTLRLYILFMAPYDESTAWSEDRLNGASRFVYRVWTLAQELRAGHAFKRGGFLDQRGDAFETEVDRMTHKTIKKIHDDLGGMRFNTVISALMEYVNFLSDAKTKARLLEPASEALAWRAINTLVQLIAPIMPHMAEELWHELGWEGSVHVSGWPEYDPQLIKDDVITVIVQVNGKVRANLLTTPDATEAQLTELAKADPKVAAYLDGVQIVKIIVIPRKVVNFVVK
jgi:leucyl-tRNA synthetase